MTAIGKIMRLDLLFFSSTFFFFYTSFNSSGSGKHGIHGYCHHFYIYFSCFAVPKFLIMALPFWNFLHLHTRGNNMWVSSKQNRTKVATHAPNILKHKNKLWPSCSLLQNQNPNFVMCKKTRRHPDNPFTNVTSRSVTWNIEWRRLLLHLLATLRTTTTMLIVFFDVNVKISN